VRQITGAFPIITLLLLTSSPVLADGVRISVKTQGGAGVQSKVWLKQGTTETEDKTSPAGEKVFQDLDCQPGIKFKIKPLNPMSTFSPTGWVDCATYLPFEVKPFKIGAATSVILDAQGNVTTPIYAAQSQPYAQELQAALASFENAASESKIGSLAFWSNELAALLRKSNDSKTASLFSAAAIELGAMAIASDLDANNPDLFTVALPNGKRVESDKANDILVDFQRDNSFETGKWDRRTFDKIVTKEARELREANIADE
jgi:hypothetical protein